MTTGIHRFPSPRGANAQAMPQILRISFLCVALGPSTYALSVEHAVTPAHLDQGNYRFSTASSPTQDGVTFHVTITAQNGDIPDGSNVGISDVTHAKNDSGSSIQIAPVEPAVPVTVKKDGRTWTADFTASRELLRNTNACCVFTAIDRSDFRHLPPSADFYELKLQDFLSDAPAENRTKSNNERFTVSIAGLRQSNKPRYERDGLPLVYCATSDHRESLGYAMDLPTSQCFFAVVGNVQKEPDKIAQCLSEWDGCLSFAITDSSDKTYSITRREFPWPVNIVETWTFPSGGMRVIPVDFTGAGWQGLPPTPSTPEIVSMTVTFRYRDSTTKMVSITSSPTDVYLCHK